MATLLLKERRIIADPYTELADDAPLPDGPVLVSFPRWLDEHEVLLGRGVDVGVRLPNDADADVLAPALLGASLLVLDFPGPKDGRAFSQARIFRDLHGFEGEIRATGTILRDQIFYMHRCGFDAFEISEDANLADILAAFEEFTIAYQAAADDHIPAYRRRHLQTEA